MPALSATSGIRPTLLDREADIAIPNRVWSSWAPAFGERSIVRALTSAESTALQRRAHELRCGLVPLQQSQRRAADTAISAMFGGFRSMRQQGDDVDGIVGVLLATLRQFPLWAIQEGCRRIAMREAGLDPRWAPNDTEVHGVVAAIVADYRKALKGAEKLLSAPVEVPMEPVRPSKDEVEAKLGRPVSPPTVKPTPDEPKNHGDGNHMQRVLADIAARKAAAAAWQDVA